MIPRRKQALWEAVAATAPGTSLRDGLERIIKARMGALIVVGDDPSVLNICSGGFLLDAAFTPQRLSELAKMDGAIILSADTSRIARANVHLVPNSNVPTTETGTRHRTAERVARSIGVPVIAASEDMAVLTVYMQDEKYQLEGIPNILNRCNQALQTLERYKTRLTETTSSLTSLEVEDLVAIRDVATVLQRTELVMRIADEIRSHLTELGEDGRLIRLQLGELMAGVEDERRLVVRDYLASESWNPDAAVSTLSSLDTDVLMDAEVVAEQLHLVDGSVDLDAGAQPRGHRMLSRIVPRLPDTVIVAVVERFGHLHKLMRATVTDLAEVEGVSDQLAQLIKAGISQQVESTILTRYE